MMKRFLMILLLGLLFFGELCGVEIKYYKLFYVPPQMCLKFIEI